MKERVIFCVDDEDIVLKSLKRELLNTLGHRYRIETAPSGKEALELFEEALADGHEVPLVIVDQIMPDMKGDEVLRRMYERSPNTLTILLTGQAAMQDVINAVNHANLYRYIAKPWEEIDLAITVREALKRYLQDRELELQVELLKETNNTLDMKVQERTRQLEIQKYDLKKLNVSKDRFFSILAHDLRAPFTGLLGIIQFMRQHGAHFSERQLQENLKILNDAADSLYALLENLLTWSRLQRGAIERHPERLRVYEMVDLCFCLLGTYAEQKQIALQNEVKDHLAMYADKQMLLTVIRNLVSNALKFTSRGGEIRLSSEQQNGSVTLTVTDTGTGIPQDAIDRLFRIDDKYYQNGTAGEEGTGLGLILCKDLVEMNHGTIAVESTVGQGSTFYVSLPATPRKNV